MKKDLLCKTFVMGVVVLFIGVGVQPAFAVETKSSDLNENPSLNDGLPELIVKDIVFWEHDPGSHFYYVYGYIKNQGDDYAYGNLTVEFTVKRTFFWLFDTWTIYKDVYSKNLKYGLAPGETISVLPSCGEFTLPLFCFARFYLKINHDKKINESNYDNNELMIKVFSFFFWHYC